MPITITWRHSSDQFPSPLSFDNKVTIFRERLWGWYLYIGELCANGGDAHGGNRHICAIPHSGFAVLTITLSYFETIGNHLEGYTGTSGSRQHFLIGCRHVFPQLAQFQSNEVDALLDMLYKGARCGLYHSSQAMPEIFLSGEPDSALIFNPNLRHLLINPHLIPQHLISHLDSYCADLREGSDVTLCSNFETRFDYELS